MINDFLENYIGFDYKQKLVMDASKALMENKKKIAPGSIAECCLVTVHEKGEIKSIGAGIPSDVINNNYGQMLRQLMNLITFQPRNETMLDFSNVGRTMLIGQGNPGGLSDFFVGGVGAIATGIQLQVGSGSTTPVRSDFNIETPLVSAPENTVFNSLAGLYNPSLGSFAYGNSIVAGGTGTITETCSFGLWADSAQAARRILIARDLISPGVSFIVGQNIAVDWTWQL